MILDKDEVLALVKQDGMNLRLYFGIYEKIKKNETREFTLDNNVYYTI